MKQDLESNKTVCVCVNMNTKTDPQTHEDTRLSGETFQERRLGSWYHDLPSWYEYQTKSGFCSLNVRFLGGMSPHGDKNKHDRSPCVAKRSSSLFPLKGLMAGRSSFLSSDSLSARDRSSTWGAHTHKHAKVSTLPDWSLMFPLNTIPAVNVHPLPLFRRVKLGYQNVRS